ncbi:PIR Superfamily Protein [Plasmodium ovale wallikeri]|uniref:PIR Superfamily Protein n=1 Tax=Plasmodium ovale wallikeri TaxID=864142 RepID=A0A1A9A9A8_PLAOA|nr:PIR Superfamily Protein [Plasmodium ovale wallikeri]SBT59221.1 PIR Superfamily Protein [Plasmodium ovale wallikeri]
MPLEIQTIYNAAYSNCIYKDKLDHYKNKGELENNNGCSDFKNRHLITQGNEQKICKAVILFFKDLNEHKDDTYKDLTDENITYENTTYKDNGCKYLFYWLYTYELNHSSKTIENTLKVYKDLYTRYNENHGGLDKLNKYIDEMNVQTSTKLVNLTNLYNELDNFFTENETKKKTEECTDYSFNTYLSYVYECRKGYDNDFCNELKNFRKKYNFFVQNVIKCSGKKDLLPPVEIFDIVGTTIIPFSFISVTSLILPILYKFTAFGPWIRRLLGRNENILEYINEEENHSLNTYEIQDDNSNMPNYYIAYNSS